LPFGFGGTPVYGGARSGSTTSREREGKGVVVTLIVPFISEQFVAVASDRRITWLIGAAPARWEDTENKAIVLAGHFLMGYTGFARLGG
jgi:hypothetical protein